MPYKSFYNLIFSLSIRLLRFISSLFINKASYLSLALLKMPKLFLLLLITNSVVVNILRYLFLCTWTEILGERWPSNMGMHQNHLECIFKHQLLALELYTLHPNIEAAKPRLPQLRAKDPCHDCCQPNKSLHVAFLPM